MPTDDTEVSVVYVPQTRELRTVPDYFAPRGGVSTFRWRAAVREGNAIQAGQTLAEIVWERGGRDPFTAPSNCNGMIAIMNGDIAYERLGRRSELLLRLSAGITGPIRAASRAVRSESIERRTKRRTKRARPGTKRKKATSPRAKKGRKRGGRRRKRNR